MLIFETLIHWIHLMAAAVWVGGMIFLSLVVVPVAQSNIPPETRGLLTRNIGLRFQKLGWIVLSLSLLTGIYKISQAGEIDFFHSVFGRLLLLKIGLFSVMIALVAVHDFLWGPRLSRIDPGTDPEKRSAILRKMKFWARVNLGIAVALVFVGACIRMNPF